MPNFKKSRREQKVGRQADGQGGAGGEEKKLSHSVFCRPPSQWSVSAEFGIEDIHPRYSYLTLKISHSTRNVNNACFERDKWSWLGT